MALLERRMNQLVIDLETQKRSQVARLMGQRNELKAAMTETMARAKAAPTARSTRDISEARFYIQSQLSAVSG